MILTEDIIDGVLQREGTTYTDRPDDKGGPTCCGITLATLRAYRAPASTSVDDLKALNPQTARPVYQHVFVDAPGFSQITDPSLQALMVDAGVACWFAVLESVFTAQWSRMTPSSLWPGRPASNFRPITPSGGPTVSLSSWK